MNILGISCYYHDAAAAILQDGKLIAASEEERFSRIKHDFSFPHLAIQFCLDSAGIKAADLDYAVFYEKPFRKFDRILMSVLQTYPQSYKVFRESMITWMIDKLWVGSKISAELGIPTEKILYCEHHMSHAASAFLCSPFEEAAILTVDGVGEWVTGTWGVGKGNQIEIRKQMMFPHSLGLLYSAFTAFLGFEVNEGEYKVMGMAPYGQPRYVEKVWKIIRQEADGSFSLDMDYFCFQHSTTRTFNKKFEQLFGAPRAPKQLFFTEDSGFPEYFGEAPSNFHELCKLNQHYADIAASIQQVTEEVLITMARQLHKETGLKNLCIAGGVGLNSVANHRILRETPFEDIFIQPAAGDGGGALGAALWADNMLLGNPRRFRMDHAYWGKGYSDAEVQQFLTENDIPFQHVGNEDKLLDLAVDRLQQGNVIGWFQGRFEWGPRALGNRSIIADARNPRMKDIVNTKIKFREPYRPFAPSVLAERTEEFFEIPNAVEQYPARYMLYVVPVRKSKYDVLPAITHVDGTGRLQTVFEDASPRYHGLIKRFSQATGIPAILNTSFNLKGEPIVNTPANAFSTFYRSEMDMLFLGNFVVEKERLKQNRQQVEAEPVGVK
ncbi:MAG: carbamoyltransferase N-terminal domain-containing protein [Candidatus Korobacteraceae bacterium]